MCETVLREEFSDENMTRDNICYRINRAIHQQASYKELSLCETAKAKIVSTFVSVRVQYALKFKNRPSPTHNQKAIKKTSKSYTQIRLVLSKMFASSSNLFIKIIRIINIVMNQYMNQLHIKNVS